MSLASNRQLARARGSPSSAPSALPCFYTVLESQLHTKRQGLGERTNRDWVKVDGQSFSPRCVLRGVEGMRIEGVDVETSAICPLVMARLRYFHARRMRECVSCEFSWKGQQALLPARENTALGYAVRAAPVPELPGLPGPNRPPIVEWVPDSSPNPIFWRW